VGMEKRQSNQMDGWSIELPYPPTINHAYMTIKSGKRLLKPEFIEFKYMVRTLVANGKQLRGLPMPPLQLFIEVYPPDKRKRDLDNIIKVLQDAIFDGLHLDDSMVTTLAVTRKTVIKQGKVIVYFNSDTSSQWFLQFALRSQN
jgi:crossover junction endodeoxyribonuclease RusA